MREATSVVRLHASKLTIDAESVKLSISDDAAPPVITALAYNIAAQTVDLTFSRPIPASDPGAESRVVALSLGFAGVLNDELAGFYRSKYMLRGEPHYMAVTQFEATDARRGFPCFDEPELKAVFSVTICAPADKTALSNGVVTRVDTSTCGKLRTWHFADTLRST